MKSLQQFIQESQECDGMYTMLKNDKEFNNAISDCQDYIDNEEDDEQKDKYQKELDKIKETDKDKQWDKLANSGIFHDAIGKVKDITDKKILYVTEY